MFYKVDVEKTFVMKTLNDFPVLIQLFQIVGTQTYLFIIIF